RAGEEVVVEGRAEAADVKEAGGARHEADADGHGRAELMRGGASSYRPSPAPRARFDGGSHARRARLARAVGFRHSPSFLHSRGWTPAWGSRVARAPRRTRRFLRPWSPRRR